MKFVVNYSPAAADLLRAGRITIDGFKCPAWPDLIAAAGALRPVHIHFPFTIGEGRGDAINSETHGPVDWAGVERFLAQSQTQHVNVHLSPERREVAGRFESTPAGALAERTLRDLEPVVRRFGADRVIVENDNGAVYHLEPAAIQPDFIRRIVADAGCGFLFDVSHARMAARQLGVQPADYIAALPVARTREIHFTGIQMFSPEWVSWVRQAGLDEATIAQLEGRWIDHLPLTAADWDFLAWSAGEIDKGAWGRPQMVAFEYGGVDWFFGAVTKPDVLLEQVPRLVATIHPLQTEPRRS